MVEHFVNILIDEIPNYFQDPEQIIMHEFNQFHVFYYSRLILLRNKKCREENWDIFQCEQTKMIT